MIGANVKKGNFGLWAVGQFAATTIGVLFGMKYGIESGIAVGYTLVVLVDIRGQIGRQRFQ